MNRAVYIGGFGNGQKIAERVAGALESRYGNIEPFTFSQAMANPDQIRRAAKGAAAITHSAGMLALAESGAEPGELAAFGPPLPLSVTQFPIRTIRKRVRMHKTGIGILSDEDRVAIEDYEASSMGELLKHPVGNFRHIGKISHFDAVEAAIATKRNREIDVSLVYTDGDEYFQLPDERERVAQAAGVSVLRLTGIHDELPLRPTATLDLFYGQNESLE